jgi:DNA mismatch repair ATPase MutS
VDAKKLRHCLIEQFQTNEIYVTNDIILGDNKTDGMLLYGTNAVGKTSFIRALGIAVILAQAGLYVPCSEFNFKPYKYIFTRIIGNDNIFKGLSTFAVEMSELRTILRLMNENSLVLGDELCSGTETMSAISIFIAGIQQLHRCGSSFIFATHLHEIVYFEEITSLSKLVQKHMAVVYDKENDALVYEVPASDYEINNIVVSFSVGENVYAREGIEAVLSKATVLAVNADGTYTVEFEDGTIEIKTANELTIYYPCNCDGISEGELILDKCIDTNYLSLKNS